MTRARMVVFLFVSVALLTPSCATTAQRALSEATDEVRQWASETRAVVDVVVRNPQQRDINDVLASGVASVRANSDDKYLLSSSIQPGNRIRLDITFVAMAGAGGGGDYETAVVRLCARYEGALGSAIELMDIDCPPGLPAEIRNLGKITAIVKLE